MADYRPATVAADKVKKHDGEMSIALERTEDILAWVGAQAGEAVCLRLLDGDARSDRELHRQAEKEKHGYDRCQ